LPQLILHQLPQFTELFLFLSVPLQLLFVKRGV
jgi:hypothetical protein